MPTKTKEAKSITVGRAASYGLVSAASFDLERTRDVALEVGFEAQLKALSSVLDELAAAKAAIDGNGDLSQSGKERRRREVAEEAIGRISSATKPITTKITTRINAIAGDESAGSPITLREMLDARGGRGDLLRVAADELAASLRLIREHFLLAPGTSAETLQEFFSKAANDGDVIAFYAADGMPAPLRDRVYARAALDDAAAARLRRRLRMTISGHGQETLADLCQIGAQACFNASAAAKRIEAAGFIAKDAQRELEGELHEFRTMLAQSN